MAPRTRLAWAINTYNFLVLDTVTEHLFAGWSRAGKCKGLRTYVRYPYESVQDMVLDKHSFFEPQSWRSKA